MSRTAPHRRGLSRDVMVGLHMQVTANLIRALGGNAAAACVLVMIQFRTQVHGYKRMDGTTWWKASLDEISRDTGLSRDQVKHLLNKLVTDGYVLKAQHFQGIGDQTASYSIVFDDGSTDLVTENPGPDPLWTTHVADSPDAGQDHVADSPDAPTHVADSPHHRGESAMGTVANPPSLPIRTFLEEQNKKRGEGPSPQAVDNFAPSRPLSRPDHCAAHQDDTNPPPCPACAEARRTMQYVQAEMVDRPCGDHGHIGKCPYCPGGRLHILEGAS